MKLTTSIIVLTLSLGVLSCSREQSKRNDDIATGQQRINAKLIQEYRAAMLQVGPVEEPVGGSAVVIIPTDDYFLEQCNRVLAKPTPQQADLMVQQSRDKFLARVEALRRRSLFDEVELVRNDDQDPYFDEDFALIPSITKPEWVVIRREPRERRTIPVPARDLSKPFSERLRVWLDEVEEAARDLRRKQE